jgi:DNA-binding transcriptional ArsR family regulator
MRQIEYMDFHISCKAGSIIQRAQALHVHKHAHILLRMNSLLSHRTRAIEAAIDSLDSAFFKALCEPPRVAVLKRVMQLGRADITEIAAELPQERSVVSRHLQVLLEVGIVRSSKSGRQVFYEVDGPAIIGKLEEILHHTKSIAPFCCPGSQS